MPKYAAPIFANAGVEAWYADQLQTLVKDMSQDLLDAVRRAWRDGGGLAYDSALITKRAAGIVFRDPQGHILLLNRNDYTGWAYPGGKIEDGETEAQAARRECYEEMRYIGFGEVGGVLDYPLQWLHIRRYFNVQFATFLCDVPEQFTPYLNDEHSAYKWIAPEIALRDLQMHAGARETLEEMTGVSIATDARPKPTTSLLLQRAMHKWGLKWATKMDRAAVKISLQFANKNKAATNASMMRQLRNAGFTVKFKPSPAGREAFDAVVAENVGLIKSIPQKYLGDVQSAVWQNIMNRGSMADMADSIQEKYGIAHRRAALIARDQNHKAKAAIERANRVDVGITGARWKHSHAGKEPRPTHVKMDGEWYDIRKGMWDKAVQKWVWPGTEINCRCTDEPEIPGFK